MIVELRHYTPLPILVEAIRTCWDSGDKSDSELIIDRFLGTTSWELGKKDKALIQNVIYDKHTSTLEHIYYNFKIEGISRLVLQELARHRMASLSVKSTRYTLGELKNEAPFIDDVTGPHWDRAKKYINLNDDSIIGLMSIHALDSLRIIIQQGCKNDEAKYVLPECYKVDLMWSINARSLQNFLNLRLSSKAHFEIRELASKVARSIPPEHHFLFDLFAKS